MLSRLIIALTLSGIIFSCKESGHAYRRTLKEDSILHFLKNNVSYAISNLDSLKATLLLDSISLYIGSTEISAKANWYLFKSELETLTRQWNRAHQYMDSAIQLACIIDTAGAEMRKAKTQLTGLLVRQQKWDSALTVGLDAYYSLETKDSSLLPLIEYRLYEIYNNLGDRKAVQKYLFNGLVHSSSSPVMQVYFKSAIAKFYDDIHQLDSAIAYYKSLEQDTTFNSTNFRAVMTENLGVLYTRQNKAALALHYLLKAIPLTKQAGTWDAFSMFNLANAYAKNRNYSQSFKYLDSAMLATDKADLNMKRKIWQLRAENMLSRNLPVAAYSFLDSAYKLFEPEIDSSMAKYARDLDAKYRFQEKEEKIKALALANKVKERTNSYQRVIIISICMAILLASVIGWMVWRRIQLSARMRESDLRWQSLGTQMESHFLFNSLGSLLSLVRSGSRELAVSYLLSFSRLVRSFLEAARQRSVLLKDELDLLKTYLDVQAINSGQQFTYEIQAYPGYTEDNIRIPAMVLQPFVENAIVHGISTMEEGRILIKIEKGQNVLHCVIEDNGVGLQPIVAAHSKRSRAIEITRERLNLLAKQTRKPASINIIDKKEQGENGVKVVLTIPFRQRFN